MLAVTVVLAIGVGISLGLLGGGGSVLTVPLLVYVAGLPARSAIATSLLVVGLTSITGVITHARAGRVRWRTGMLFGGVGIAAAYLGGRLADRLPEALLLAGFGLLMLLTATAMLRGRPDTRPAADRAASSRDVPTSRVLMYAPLVGLLTGLFGAGGGFLIVPALTLLGGLPMPNAVATSLLVIGVNSTAGLLGHLHGSSVDWALAAAVTSAAVLGSLLGSRLVGRVPPDQLRRAFGWMVMLVAVFVLAHQIPGVTATVALLATLLTATAATLGAHWGRPAQLRR